MTDETGASAGGEAIAADLPADAPESFASASEAAAYFTSLAEKRNKSAAESADTATADTKSPVEGDAAAVEEQPTGETEEADPAEKPPLELPRSWTKDRAEHWAKLDPDTQVFLLEQDSKASAEVRRVQNEAAEQRKAVQAEREATEKVRQQFEAKIKTASEILEREQLRDFPDIKTMADVERMAAEDPFRKIQWDVHQQKMQAVAWEADQAESRKAQEHQTEWNNHVQAENAKASELIPELADKIKGPALMTRAAERLGELGFKPEELNDLASGKTKLSIYDHRLQQLIFSDLKLADIQRAKTAVAKPDLPPVTRPGTSRPSGQAVHSERIQALNRKPELSVKEATELYTLQQASQRRAP